MGFNGNATGAETATIIKYFGMHMKKAERKGFAFSILKI